MTSRNAGLGSFREPDPANVAAADRRAQVQFRLNRAQIRALKQVALDDDVSIQEFLLQLVRDEFTRRGLGSFPD